MKADEVPPIIDEDAFAKAGEALKKLNDGEAPDLTPCGQVADVLKKVRTEEGFLLLDETVQARLRAAAASVHSSFGKDDTRLRNFLAEAFGATKRPAKAESHRRERIGTFLLNMANPA